MRNDPPPAQGPTGWGAPSGRVAPRPAYRPLGGPARIVYLLLAVFALVTVAAMLSDWLEVSLLTRILHDPASVREAEATASDDRQALLGVVQLGAFLLTAVGFLVWFRRAYTNLPGLGMEPLPFGTGWTVGAWVVPFLNLVRPKQIMDTIWRGSDPGRPSFDARWREGPVPLFVHLWWAVFLLSGLVDWVLVAALGDGSGSVESLRRVSLGTLGTDALDLVLALLCFEVVRRTTRRQQARADRLAAAPPA
jgi:Domain of unknown function (DUF4328)